MKLMQINVWQGRILQPLLNLIKQEAPDVIFTQEIFSYPAPIDPGSPWKQFNMTEQIKRQGPYEHSYFSASSLFSMLGHELRYGNAIFSKYPLKNPSTHYTGGASGPQRFDDPAHLDGNSVRNFQHAQITVGNTTINLINHHGHWINQPDGDDISTQRLLGIASYIKGLQDPVIMAGDLNLAPSSAPIRTFLSAIELRDLVAPTHATTTLSPAHHIQNIVCDYILASPSLNATSVRVSDQLVSDHRAVIAEINYN